MSNSFLTPIPCPTPLASIQRLKVLIHASRTFGAAFMLLLAWNASNIAGHSKKVTANALTLVAFCLGNILGTQTFQDKEAPGYRSGKVSSALSPSPHLISNPRITTTQPCIVTPLLLSNSTPIHPNPSPFLPPPSHHTSAQTRIQRR